MGNLALRDLLHPSIVKIDLGEGKKYFLLQSYSDRIEQVFVAYDLYKKGMEAFEFGCLSDALPALQSCYQIRTKAMYAHHVSEHYILIFDIPLRFKIEKILRLDRSTIFSALYQTVVSINFKIAEGSH